jgi:hypothetical protein
MRYEEYIKTKMDEFVAKSFVKPDEFPDMMLYIDQIAAFLNGRLKVYAREGEKPIITKSMIANYLKRDMLPRPQKKKYTRDHMILIAMIFYLKSVFQMSEIGNIMKPFVENYDSAFDDKFDFYRLYEIITPILKKERAEEADRIQKDIELIKDAIREEELDDDSTEMFLLLLSVTARADAAKYAAKSLFSEYYAKQKKNEGAAVRSKRRT